jgi:alkylation response protein AidB-like acyl-CoA dehydrogenase
VRFAFEEEELVLKDTVAELLAKHYTPGAPLAQLLPLWKQLAEVGVQSLCVPAEANGSAAPLESLALVLREAGRAALALPLADTALVGAPLLAAAGDPGGHLAGLIDGSLVLSVADGELVPASSIAGLFLLRGGVLATRDEVDLEEVMSVDAWRALSRVRLHVGAGRPVVQEAEVRDRAALGAASELVGLGRQMVAMTVEYVRQRRQFGVPVGSFQAVKHRLADAHLQLELAEPAVWAAAFSLGRGETGASRAVSLAKSLASEAAWGAARAALQCHGATGYTVEHPLHFWLKRTWCLAFAFGSAEWHRDRVGRLLGL